MLYKDVWLSNAMVDEIAVKTRSQPRTVQRSIKKGRIPDTPYQLLRITENGTLGAIHSDWHGWTICRKTGQLRTPNGENIHPGDIQAIPYRKHLLAHLQAELRVSREKRDLAHGTLAKPRDPARIKYF